MTRCSTLHVQGWLHSCKARCSAEQLAGFLPPGHASTVASSILLDHYCCTIIIRKYSLQHREPRAPVKYQASRGHMQIIYDLFYTWATLSTPPSSDSHGSAVVPHYCSTCIRSTIVGSTVSSRQYLAALLCTAVLCALCVQHTLAGLCTAVNHPAELGSPPTPPIIFLPVALPLPPICLLSLLALPCCRRARGLDSC